MAYAEDKSTKIGRLDTDSDLSIGTDIRFHSPLTLDNTKTALLSPQLEKAVLCEEDAQRLGRLMERLEESGRSMQLALSASKAIEELLLDAARLLEQGRQKTGMLCRETLTSTYREIIRQIDSIVDDAEFNGQNYATGDVLEVMLDRDGSSILKMENFSLTSASMGLTTHNLNLVSDGMIIAEMARVEDASNTLRSRRTHIEMAASVLKNRSQFARDKIQVLQDATKKLTNHGQTQIAIQEFATKRLSEEARSTTKVGINSNIKLKEELYKSFRNDNFKHIKRDELHTELFEDDEQECVNIEGQQEIENEYLQNLIDKLEPLQISRMNELAMELSRILDEEGYIGQWMKFDNGQADIFVRNIAKTYGPEAIRQAKQKYEEDEAFKELSKNFRQSYEQLLLNYIADDPEPKAKIDSALKTHYGTVYILLARAAGMV